MMPWVVLSGNSLPAATCGGCCYLLNGQLLRFNNGPGSLGRQRETCGAVCCAGHLNRTRGAGPGNGDNTQEPRSRPVATPLITATRYLRPADAGRTD